MPVDITRDDVLTLRQACQVLPRLRGRRPHVCTLWRWANRGLRGVRLEIGHIGGTAVTTRAALQEFVDRIANARGSRDAGVNASREHERAKKYLVNRGILGKETATNAG